MKRDIVIAVILLLLLAIPGAITSKVSKRVKKVKTEKKVVAPMVNPDNSVTFTYSDSVAKNVHLLGSFVPKKNVLGLIHKDGKLSMTKEENIWKYTTKPLISELYTYTFEVDKKELRDPLNPNFTRDVEDTLSYFIIPGGIADDYMEKKVPHGTVKKVWYPTVLEDMDKRRMSVYFPPGYFVKKNKKKRYPVLYLLHGSGGDEDAWADGGRAIQILDNLIAQRRCIPMIVVMPNGNASLVSAPGSDPEHPDVVPTGNNTSSMFGKIEAVFMQDVVKFVDTNFRTLTDKSHRAIAGLSLGGLHTMYISMNNPDAFDYVGLFSAQTTNGLSDRSIRAIQKIGDAWIRFTRDKEAYQEKEEMEFSKWASDDLIIYEDEEDKLKNQFANPPKLYYIACGKDDFIKRMNDKFRHELDKNGYEYVYNETDGGHTWENWRKYLVDFLPRIFK